MPSQQKRRAQGGGRTPNSEPRLQVFKEFNGVNFENAVMDYVSADTFQHDDLSYQSDLQMNYLHLQNNVAVKSNKTLEVRDEIVDMFTAPEGTSFTGVVKLIGPKLYAAKDDQNVGVADLDSRAEAESSQVISDNVTITNHDQSSTGHDWTSFGYYDDKLIGLTDQNEIWVASVDRDTWETGEDGLENSMEVADPTVILPIDVGGGGMENAIRGIGTLQLSSTFSATTPHRISFGYAYTSRYGSTNLSPMTTFYANTPVSEWHAGCYLEISFRNQADGLSDIEYVDLYYMTDNAMEPIFLDRVVPEKIERYNDLIWFYHWYGYIDATSMWATASLVPPAENTTKGVHASRMCDIDGRLYFWGDKDQPQRLYIGGNPGNLLNTGPGVGGGFVDVEPGTGQAVRHVCKYKTQSGNSIVTMLCDSPNSRKEQRFNLVENTVSLSNEQSMRSWYAEQVAGAVGCKSYDGAVVCQDGLYSISRYGLALTTMTMEYNSQIRTTYVSDPIKPVFTDAADKDVRLSNAVVLECDGVIYMALGTDSEEEGRLDKVVFCYDIDLKAWWTCTLDVSEPILNMFHIDWQGQREGIGIVTPNHIYMLPTTDGDPHEEQPIHTFKMETGQLSTQMPKQGWQYLSQLEFHFDYLVGNMDIRIRTVDMFGRRVDIVKHVSTDDTEYYDYTVRMRVDQRVMSYVLTFSGQARFRMTHFIARVYTLSNKIGQVWGFDDSMSYRTQGDVHPTFKCYNDVRRAIFT